MNPWLTFLMSGAAVALVYGVLLAAEAYHHHRPPQTVRCPETGKVVRVQLDATLAALTAVPGPPKLRVDRCELWPEHQECTQECTRMVR
jgi:hypothetical protein